MPRIGKCPQWPHLYTTYGEAYNVKQAQDEIFVKNQLSSEPHFKILYIFWRRKAQESKTIQQNVRNGHIYIQLVKQYMT